MHPCSIPRLFVVAVSFVMASVAAKALAQCDSGMPGSTEWTVTSPDDSDIIDVASSVACQGLGICDETAIVKLQKYFGSNQ